MSRRTASLSSTNGLEVRTPVAGFALAAAPGPVFARPAGVVAARVVHDDPVRVSRPAFEAAALETAVDHLGGSGKPNTRHNAAMSEGQEGQCPKPAGRTCASAWLPKHPTLNIQRPTSSDCPTVGHWMFDVGCWMLDVPRCFQLLIVRLPILRQIRCAPRGWSTLPGASRPGPCGWACGFGPWRPARLQRPGTTACALRCGCW